MATPLSYTSQTCLSCLRRLSLTTSPVSTANAALQIRGKKKYRKKGSMRDPTVARLEKDIERYGPKGTLLRVTRGFLRNHWQPRGYASHVSKEELKTLSSKIAFRKRSYTLHPEKESTQSSSLRSQLNRLAASTDKRSALSTAAAAVAKSGIKAAKASRAEAARLTPEQKLVHLRTLVPRQLTFARKLVPAPAAPAASITAGSTPKPAGPAPTDQDLHRLSNLLASSSTELADLKTELASTPTPSPLLASTTAGERRKQLERHVEKKEKETHSLSTRLDKMRTAVAKEAEAVAAAAAAEAAMGAKEKAEKKNVEEKRKAEERAQQTQIFGSVSLSDVVSAVRKHLQLSGQTDAMKAAPAAEDIKILGSVEPAKLGTSIAMNSDLGAMKMTQTGILEGDKIKHLGQYVVDILVPGAGAGENKVTLAVRVVNEEFFKDGDGDAVTQGQNLPTRGITVPARGAAKKTPEGKVNIQTQRGKEGPRPDARQTA